MPARLKTSDETQPIRRGHGREGYVRLHADVPPAVKDKLVARATAEGSSLVEQIRAALEAWAG